MKKIIMTFFVLVLITGCQEENKDSNVIKLRWLYHAEPYEDFKSAIEKEDYRFIGIYGYSLTVPGVSIKCLDIKSQVKPIDGTSDAHDSYEEDKLNAIAWVYAKDYNFRMRVFLMEKVKFSCDSE